MSVIRFMSTAVLTLTAVLTFSAGLANAGWIQKSRNGDTVLFSGGMVKNVSKSGRGSWTIINMNTGVMTMVDGKRRLYTSGGMGEYCSGAKAMMDKMMANIPPEQREMMKQMMKKQNKGKKPKVSIKKAGPGGKVAGLATIKYKVIVDGNPAMELWMAHDTPMFKEMEKYKGKMSQWSAQMEGCTSEGFGGGGFDPDSSAEYKKLEEGGLVMKKIVGGRTISEIISIKKKNIPKSEFQPPKGFKKVPFPDFLMGQMGQMGKR